MFVYFTVVLICAYCFEVLLQRIWIGQMRKMKIEQITKMYGPSWHDKAKMGTPSMGGVAFIPAALLCTPLIMSLAPGFSWTLAAKILSYPILAAAVGFIDDWLKHSRHSSDGLTSLQKLALQIAITLPWAVWIVQPPCYILPNLEIPRALFIAAVLFIGVGLQNAVNVTDGLDGLAAGCALISFIGAVSFINAGPAILLFLAMACGLCLGFLWHNSFPASVFMGDVGAHFLAGLLLSICLNAGVMIMVVPLGFFFGVEICSVAIQIVAIRCFHRKVFRMSPIHHHFEMLGWKETQIVTRFWVMHILGISILTSALFYFALRNF